MDAQQLLGQQHRFVLDIDGCLRGTDRAELTPDEIIALHGAIAPEATIVQDRNGIAIRLQPGERVPLDEGKVAFFRSRRPKLSLAYSAPPQGN